MKVRSERRGSLGVASVKQAIPLFRRFFDQLSRILLVTGGLILVSDCRRHVELTNSDLEHLNQYYENSLMEAEQYDSGLARMYCPLQDYGSNTLFWIDGEYLYKTDDLLKHPGDLYRSKLAAVNIKRDDVIREYYQGMSHFQKAEASASTAKFLEEFTGAIDKGKEVGFKGQEGLPVDNDTAPLYRLLPCGVDLHYIQRLGKGWDGRTGNSTVALGSFPYRAEKDHWAYIIILVVFSERGQEIVLDDVYPLTEGPAVVLRFKVYETGPLWRGPEIEFSFSDLTSGKEGWLGDFYICDLRAWSDVCKQNGTCNPFKGK